MIDWDKFDNAVEASVLYRDSFGKTVAQRVVKRPTQKTVADAVEAHPLGWCDIPNQYGGKADGVELVLWDKVHGGFEKGCDGYNEKVFYKVCTRDEFEAYVKEQEGEKWTHAYNQAEVKCKIIQSKPDFNGCVVVFNDFEEYQLIEPVDLKPIKPTISESELMERIKYRAISIDDDDEFGAKVRSWIDKYNII